MTRKRKKILIVVGIIIILIVGVLFFLQSMAKNKFEDFVKKLPEQIEFEYENVDIGILSGNLIIEKPHVSLSGKTTGDIIAELQMASLEFLDLSYWDYLMNSTISINEININELKTTYYHNELMDKNAYKDQSKASKINKFKIGNLNLNNADIEVFDVENDSLLFKTETINFRLSSIDYNSKTSKNKIPIDFNDLSISSKNLFYRMNSYDNITLDSLEINRGSSVFSNLKLATKYSKTELSQHLQKERDHYNLDIPRIEIKNQDAGFHKDSIYDFKSEEIIFENPKLEIYRDKLVADDTVIKSLYSKMLRELNFNLTIENLLINNGTIIYEEKVKPENKAGQLNFTNLNASMANVSNTYKAGELTKIDIESIFMENTPLNVDWNFDVNDESDHFVFKADVGSLAANDLNQFMQPNLNIKLEGTLLKTYFTIDGNNTTSTIDLKTQYDNFDVVILQNDGKEKNKLLSGLLNLFIKSDSMDDSEDFRYGNSNDVERNKTKSIFNYLWINAKAGLQSAMTGNGEKKD